MKVGVKTRGLFKIENVFTTEHLIGCCECSSLDTCYAPHPRAKRTSIPVGMMAASAQGDAYFQRSEDRQIRLRLGVAI
jgi:hypothetical protein